MNQALMSKEKLDPWTTQKKEQEKKGCTREREARVTEDKNWTSIQQNRSENALEREIRWQESRSW
jgi:hypothetical protein